MPVIKPDKVENYLSPADYQARLRQLRATYVPGRSTAEKQAYWAGTIKQWILLTQNNNGYLLCFYKNCPC